MFFRICHTCSLILKQLHFTLFLQIYHAGSFTRGIKFVQDFLTHSNSLKQLGELMTELYITNSSYSLPLFLHLFLRSYWHLYNAFWFILVQIKCTVDNPFWLVLFCRTDTQFSLVRVDLFLFALAQRTDIQIRKILRTYLRINHIFRVSHLRSYRANTHWISSYFLQDVLIYISNCE